jgi:phosphoglycerate dehydrogenase-like enzyme
MKIAITSDYQKVALKSADWSKVARVAQIDVYSEPFKNFDDTVQHLKDYEIICAMRERIPFPRALFERLPRLKFLASPGVVNFAIDLKAAAEHGVIVSGTGNGPGLHTTAELAWGLVLDLTRHITREHNAVVQQGKWQTTLGRRLAGRTLGLVGLGNIGSMVAGYGRAFGMNVLAWSANLTRERAAAAGAKHVPLDELMERSDVISVHVILSDRTRGLLDDRLIRKMKPTAIIVNTSRGPIIDEVALVHALRERWIAGAGLDVFEPEPIPAGHPYRSLDNVLITPHLGYVTEEVYDVFYGELVEDVEAFLAGRPIRRYTNNLAAPFLPDHENGATR